MKVPRSLYNDHINDKGEIVQTDMVKISIDRIKFAYETAQAKGLGALYVCFSGGKDSVALAALCEEAKQRHGVEYELHYNITGIDPPELFYFIRDEYPQCHRHQPEKSIFKLIVEKKMPPTRLVRYCCAELKERGGHGRMCLTGVRWAESARRKNTRKPFENQAAKAAQAFRFNDNGEDRQSFEHCEMKRALICNPIIDWTDKQIWDFIKGNDIPYCKLYDQGYKRLGCIGCPMSTNRKKELDSYPKFKQAYIRAFQRMLDSHPETEFRKWKTAQDVYDWWVEG